MDWLSVNAVAIQAAAAIVSSLTTAVLVALTGRYVLLTKKLSEAADAQLTHLREHSARTSDRALRAVGVYAVRIRAASGMLHKDSPRESELRQFSGITDFDMHQLETLARQCDAEVDGHASLAALQVRWLLGLIERIKTADPRQGYVLTSLEEQSYIDSLSGANEALDSIIRLCSVQAPNNVVSR